MPSAEEFIAAGLYHPENNAEFSRLELLDWLFEMGFTIDEMVFAKSTGSLSAIANDRRTLPGERLSRAAAIEMSGMATEDFDAFLRAVGLTKIGGAPVDEIGVTKAEVDALVSFGLLGEIFSRDETLAYLRVIGSAMSRIGEAGVSLFLADVEAEMLTAGHNELELAKKGYDAVGLIDRLSAQFEPLLRRHILQATERSRVAQIEQGERFLYRYAVGFVDLVGFTEISAAMQPKDLAVFIRDFEGRAHDIVTAVGARLVKLIGDEVMFVATDPEAACVAGSRLMAGFGSEMERVVPRGGLAFGDVLVRGGDYYGPIVNLAARLVNEAVPQELLVTEELAVAAPTSRFEPAGRRMVKGFAHPIRVHSFAFD
jgi:class 3 adenylate cyclase